MNNNTAFSNKIVVISGASSGIGRGIAAAFAAQGAQGAQGAQVLLGASNEQRLSEAADAIARSSGATARPDTCAADLRTEAGCQSLFDAVASRRVTAAATSSCTRPAPRVPAPSSRSPTPTGWTASR